MLEKLKNVLTQTPPAFPPASSQVSTPDVIAAEVSLKKKQLCRGQTRARVAAMRVQVEEARRSLVDAKQTLGERMRDGEEVTNITGP